jgi:hypothetical protein
MTTKLTPQELAELEQAGLLETLEDVRAAAANDVPEPSPLYWDHLSARVKAAVDAEPMPSASSGWRAWWRPIVICSTAMATIAIAVALRVMPVAPAADTTASNEAAAAAELADASAAEETSAMWDAIGAVAPKMPVSAAMEAGLAPGRYATDAAIEDLTEAQRRELVRLLRLELSNNP